MSDKIDISALQKMYEIVAKPVGTPSAILLPSGWHGEGFCDGHVDAAGYCPYLKDFLKNAR